MKKTVKTLTLILAFILLLSSLSLSVFAAEVDYQKEIENFVQSPNNSFELKVGESDEPLAAIWVKNGGSAYSENENVVTVDEKGKVTAVGVGSAHVVLAGSTGMADVYLYTVTEKEENSPIGGGTIIPSVPDNTTAKPTESSSVATSTKKKTKSTKNILEEVEHDDDTYEKASAFVSGSFTIFPIIFVCIAGLAIYLVFNYFNFSRKAMRKRTLPPRRITENTVTAPAPALTVCPNCGTPFGDKGFCANCGQSRQVMNVYRVPIDKKVNAISLEEHLNEWFAQNPYIYDCRVRLETDSYLGSPFLRQKFFAKSAVVEYTLASQPQPHQFGFAFLYKLKFFGFGYDAEKQAAEWEKNNPGCRVITTHSARHVHTGDSYYSEHYNYVLFRKDQ